jgi:hypothetical protein
MGRQRNETSTRGTSKRRRSRLPRRLRPLFWEYRFSEMNWGADYDLIVARVLSAGDWPTVRWLYRRLGAERLTLWLTGRRGAGLSPRQLRFWETILKLPHREVSGWLAHPGRRVWDGRCHA